MIYNKQMECMSREDMRALQSERLIKTVKTCYEKVPFYRRKMDKMGVKPEDIRGLDDITKLPFTTKYDLRDEYPFGLRRARYAAYMRRAEPPASPSLEYIPRTT